MRSITALVLFLLLGSLAFARGGGGCFLPGTLIQTPYGDVPIEQLQPGYSVQTFSPDGVGSSTVLEVYQTERSYFYSIHTAIADVNATAEHPFYVGNSTFKEAAALQAGDIIYLLQNGSLYANPILSTTIVNRSTMAYNLQVAGPHTFFANDFAVHNKGGCFLPGTPVLTPDGSRPIETLQAGDSIYAFDENDMPVITRVLDTYRVVRDHYYMLHTEHFEVNATAEHPFYTSHGFVTVEDLKPGDSLYLYENGSLSVETLRSIDAVYTPTIAYNLQVDEPHTFFANSFAVHNKGGCFLPGTPVLTPNGSRPIESLEIGDSVYSFDEYGHVLSSHVLERYSVVRDSYYSIRTASQVVNATAEHPFLTSLGYTEVQNLHVGDIVFIFNDGHFQPQPVVSIELIHSPVVAYNLQVDGPHTFLANGFAVHNKGGGGGSSHSSGPPPNVFYYSCQPTKDENGTVVSCCKQTSSKYVALPAVNAVMTASYPYCACTGTSCGCTDNPDYHYPIQPAQMCKRSLLEQALDVLCVIPFFIIVAIYMFFFLKGSRDTVSKLSGEWSSTVSVSQDKITAKAQKTAALLDQWRQVDPLWDTATIKKTSAAVFNKLQSCWSQREYGPMQPLLTPSLYTQHISQLDAMKARHELNKLEDLKLLRVEIILVRNYHNPQKDQFTVWLQAKVRDIIVDDRTGNKIRGDIGIGTFEEFWTFLRDGSQWKLRSIDQPEEAMDLIGRENYDSISTPGMMARSYEKSGSAARANVQVTAVREQEPAAVAPELDTVKWKSGRVHRLLNFLYESDRIWTEEQMKDTVRTMFIQVNTATEKRDLSGLTDVAPGLLSRLETSVQNLLANHQRIEKRNLAVRAIELVLVRNFSDNRKDEFTAWVSAQAQQMLVDEQKKQEIQGDSEVRDYEEFWTFGRNGNRWVLKAIDPGFKSDGFVNQENFDEGSTKFLMDWYYTRERAI